MPTVERTKSWEKKHINPHFLRKIIEFCTNGRFWEGCILEWGFLQLYLMNDILLFTFSLFTEKE